MARDHITSLSDEALLVLFARGDTDASRILASRHLALIYRHAVRMLGETSEAEDVAQEALFRLWKIAPEWRAGEAKVSTWLYRVTANLCTDRLRRRRSATLDDIPEPADPAPGALEQIQTRARDEALRSALGALPERQRQAVVLRHLEGLSNPEIADVMEISARAVESLTARGKRALAALLAGRRTELGYSDEEL